MLSRQFAADDALRVVSDVFSQTFDVEHLRLATSLRTLNAFLYSTETAEERMQRKHRVIYAEEERIRRRIRGELLYYVGGWRPPRLFVPAPQLFGACGDHVTVDVRWRGGPTSVMLFDKGVEEYVTEEEITDQEVPWDAVDAVVNYSKAKGLKLPWNWHEPLPRSRMLE
jgi:hypothetical protein